MVRVLEGSVEIISRASHHGGIMGFPLMIASSTHLSKANRSSARGSGNRARDDYATKTRKLCESRL